MRKLLFAALTATLFANLTSVAFSHTNAPTQLVATGSTEASVSLDWAQDYQDSYNGYFVRVNGGARVKYPQSQGTVSGLQQATTYTFCVSIDLTSSTHPDESNQTCIATATRATAATPTPTATPNPTTTATPTPTPTATPPAQKQPSYPRFTWTKSSSTQAEFDQVKALGFTHAMVNPDATQLTKIANAGLRAVVWGGNYSDSCGWNWSDATFTAKVNAAKASPYGGLIDYVFIADEPHGPGSGACPNSVADLQARNALSKSLLPDAKTLISENRKADWGYVGNIADVFLPIIYPCSYANGCVPSKVNDGVTLMNTLGITRYWATVQAFKEPAGGYYRAPSALEEQAIFARWHTVGAQSGSWAYAWGDSCCGDDVGLRDLPELWPVWQAENAS